MSNFIHSIKSDFVVADNADHPCVKLIINGIEALELPLEYTRDIEQLSNLLNCEGVVYL